ncbi:hypothetical protein BDQ17DRAFT_1331888 [Cyathus striatus]|nr:hypothetical protein BDQ17DRAFT_1331888 [Cyathus striatus]
MKLDHIKNKSSKRRTLGNLFHACMDFILGLLQTAGHEGVELVSGDGTVCQCYPILAITGYGCYYQIWALPFLPTPRNGIGDSPTHLPPCNNTPICTALATVPQGSTAFNKASTAAGIKPVPYPFWRNLPYVNIYWSITPDILYQLFQGVIKHVIGWIHLAPPYLPVHERNFHLSRVTGTEHNQISQFLLALVMDIWFSNHPLSPTNVWFELFTLFSTLYKLYGTMDNTNTQKDEFSQMTSWLECKEQVFEHDKVLHRCFFKYGALDFKAALAHMVVQAQHPEIMDPQLICRESGSLSPSQMPQFKVWLTQYMLNHHALENFEDKQSTSKGVDKWFKGNSPSIHFAYVEWFTPFSAAVIDPASLLYKVSCL